MYFNKNGKFDNLGTQKSINRKINTNKKILIKEDKSREKEKLKKETEKSKIISIERRKSVNHVNKNSEELSLRKDLEALLEANYEVMNKIKEIQSRLN